MKKSPKSKKIKNFSQAEEDEIMESLEEFNNEEAKDVSPSENTQNIPSKVSMDKFNSAKRIVSNLSNTLNESADDGLESDLPQDQRSGERYQSDLSGLSGAFSQGASRVSNIIKDMKKRDLTKSEKERKEEEQLQNGLKKDENKEGFNPKEETEKAKFNAAKDTDVAKDTDLEKRFNDRKTLQDNQTIIESGKNYDEAIKNKDKLDKAFQKPKKKDSLLDKLFKSKKKAKDAVKKKAAAVKEKGIANTVVEKVTHTAAKTAIGFSLKIVLFIILFILLFTIIVAIIFYYTNNYTREQDNNLDAKRLDTRAAKAIYALKEDEALKTFYGELISNSSGELQTRYKKNLSRLVPSDDLEKVRAAEDPSEAFLLQDSSNWFLLYLERLSYAWGGYLDWEPEYIVDGAPLGETSSGKDKLDIKTESYGASPGSVKKQVKLVNGSTEVDAVNEIIENIYRDKITYIVDQYNRWMLKFTNYYLTNYEDKFIRDTSGNLIPEIYKKNIYGENISDTVIKYQSYIHSVIANIFKYNTKKTYSGDSLESAYSQFKTDLVNEVNDLSSLETEKEKDYDLADTEELISVNRYEMSFEVLRTINSDNNMLKNAESLNMIMKSLSYSVPAYEYVTVNMNEAKKSFFGYEIYSPEFYNPDFTLKIKRSNFDHIVAGLNNINLSMKSFVNNGWSVDGENSVTTRTENAFDYMYLNDTKAYESRNHEITIPEDITKYYFVVNNNKYNKMIEEVDVVENYHSGEVDGDDATGTYYQTEWEVSSGDGGANYVFDSLDTNVKRKYYQDNLVPKVYTSLKYQIDFEYVKVDDGDREIDTKPGTTTVYEAKVYKKLKDAFGDYTGEEEYVKTIYRKEIAKQNKYQKEKKRDMKVTTRGVN